MEDKRQKIKRKTQNLNFYERDKTRAKKDFTSMLKRLTIKLDNTQEVKAPKIHGKYVPQIETS